MKRKITQWLALLCTNGYLPGFLKGEIYKGQLKQLCVPGLNCYSCPGALGACPIGALQAVIGSVRYSVSFYVLGFLMAVGLLLGRAVCGFLCPFGLIQELIHKIPVPKIKNAWRWPQSLKFVVLAVFVVGLPLLLQDNFGISNPAFCQYICPAGTLTAAIPLLSANEALRSTIGVLFYVKCAIAAMVIVGCLLLYRFFCRYLCPLGAIYALFNRISLYRLRHDAKKCTHCGACKNVCKMGVDPSRRPNSMECIRCGDCVKVCPHSALEKGFFIPDTDRKPACASCGKCSTKE